MRAPDGEVPRRLSGRRADFAALVVGAALLAFVTVRSVLVPITHDEAFTYLHWVTSPWRAVFLFDGPEPANNHLLNTVLAKVSCALLGPREMALRLPNVAAFAAYLGSVWLLLRRYASPFLALAGLVLASANRHVLEMFSLARGYGLSVGLVLAGLFFAALAIERAEDSRRDESVALGLVALAAFAQFVALDVFAALAAVLAVLHAARAMSEAPSLCSPRDLFRRLLSLFAVSAGLALCLGGIVWRIGESGGFYAGGTTGLWRDVAENLVWLTLLPAPWADAATKPILAVVAGLLLLLCAAGARLAFRRPRTSSERVGLALIACFALTVAAVKTQSVVFGLRYPTDRIATFFIPLFVVATTLAAATAPATVRKAASALWFGLALVSVAHLVRFAETRQSALWWFDADVRHAVADMAVYAGEARRGRPLRVASISHCEPALNYERVVGRLAWLAPVERIAFEHWDYDLYYVTKREEAAARRWGFRVLRRYPETGNLLLLPPR